MSTKLTAIILHKYLIMYKLCKKDFLFLIINGKINGIEQIYQKANIKISIDTKETNAIIGKDLTIHFMYRNTINLIMYLPITFNI